MSMHIRPVPDSPADQEPNVVGTPEGDNEFAPDQPLKPSEVTPANGLQDPRGNEPDSYKQDHD